MSEKMKQSVATNVEHELASEMYELVESGELDSMVDAEMKNEETFIDKILNIFVKN